jgi:hypothetical protein
MTLLPWLLPGLAVLVLAGGAVVVAGRSRRLHRLHVRTDAARAALGSALERRAAQALAGAGVLAAVPGAGDRARQLRAAVAAARAARAGGGDREAAENVLGRALAAVPRSALPGPLLEELVDAEQLLVLARRVYNDAVRDTRELRSRRLVRRLHLAGTAPVPEYFEIADAEPGVTTAAPEAGRVAPPA